ncbi:MAG: polyphosphate kinase 1 [Ruminococcus sp.]|jgi:polyphosphate kinase|nr:polyphosphate kinase 1 [Ruminococcus sp.]
MKKYYDNRELSWLKFNERVLEEASDSSVPLGERLNFAAIFQSNLDEFFMIRVGSLCDCISVGSKPDNKTGMTAAEQLELIYRRVAELTLTRDASYFAIMNALHQAHDVEQVDFRALSKKEEEVLRVYFENEILPLVSAQVVDKRYPFPFPQNKGIYAVAHLEWKNGVRVGLVPANGAFKRVIYIPTEGKLRFMLVEELILHFLPLVFANQKILSKSLMRITRNADINLEEAMYDHDLDYREIMSSLLKKRKKLAPVRMELSRNLSEPAVEYLRKKLMLTPSQIFYVKSPLDMSFVYTLRDEIEPLIPDIYYPHYITKQPRMIDKNRPVMEQVRERDLLLSYPYESIRPFLQLLSEATADKDVVSIKITLYRVASHSKVVESLINAAESGKNVVVLVELRARFDEENNIGWSKRLEQAGCSVIYGPEGLKVHSKLLLITRKNGDTVEYITQIGTGNYNEKTSALYTDFSLITANREIGADAGHVFNCLATGTSEIKTDVLIAAPLMLQRKIAELIDRQIIRAKDGKSAYIGLKMNSLTDKFLIDKLVEASQAGVKIDMAIRGISCLIANVPGYTENIKIISVVGRFLEHSRIYIFGDPADTEKSPDVYISSADFMTRNTIRRIEIAAPIFDSGIKKRIIEIFGLMFADNLKARVMQSDGSYTRRPLYPNEQPLSIQETLMKQAETAAAKAGTSVHVKKIKRKKPHAD